MCTCINIINNASSHFQLGDDTRIVVDGEPGAGKTTFMKKLCDLWAKGEEPMKKYNLVIALILRTVKKEESSLENILKDQMPFLEETDVEFLITMINSEANKVCIILDGFDEYVGKTTDIIMKLIKAQVSKEVTLLTTTRPHKVSELRSFGSKTVQQHIRLKGFNRNQVKKYVKQYFQNKEETNKMISYIEEHKLWKLARIPIRLQIMCLVWAFNQTLGKNIVELYEQFIKCLSKKMAIRRKESKTHQISSNEETLLSALGKLANQFDAYGQIKSVFLFEELEAQLGDLFDDITTFGCITKYHPSHSLREAPWAFTHLSLQEYFIALDLSEKQENYINEFLVHIKTVSLLERHQLIIKFLCSMKPKTADQIVSKVVKRVHGEDDCRRLLVLLLELLEHYKNPYLTDLPLPSILSIERAKESLQLQGENLQTEESLKLHREKLKYLFDSDSLETNKNMKTLKIYDFKSMPTDLKPLSYVENLYMHIKDPQSTGTTKNLMKTASGLNSLHLTFSNKCKKGDIESILQCTVDTVPNLPTLTIQGTGIIGNPCWKFAKLKMLKHLKIIDDQDVHEGDVEDLTTALDDLELRHLFIGCTKFNSAFMTLKANEHLKLYFKIQKCDVNLFSQYTRTKQNHINMLDLSQSQQNKDKSKLGALYGKYLSDIFEYLPQLKILRLRNSQIDKNVLGKLLEKFEGKRNRHENLVELDMVANSMKQGGGYFGKILSYFPKLNTLLISLSLSDMLDFADALEESVVISKLMIAGSDLTSQGPKSQTSKEQNDLTLLWNKLTKLNELYLIHNEICCSSEAMKNVFPSGHNMCFEQLQVLYFREPNDLSQDAYETCDSIEPLSVAVKSMPVLRELHVPAYKSTAVKDIIELITNLPKSIKYLNLSDNKIAGMMDILEVKEKLNKLTKLQIGFDEDDEEDIGIIRQDLEQTLQVYHDTTETKMKVLQCSSDSTPSMMDLEPMKDVDELFAVIKDFRETLKKNASSQ